MRHVIVTRMAMGVVALLVAASLVFAWHTGPEVVPPARDDEPRAGDESPVAGAESAASGAESYARACARCHDAGALGAELVRSPDPARAVLRMLDFLDRHGDSGPAEDRAIVEYLLDTAHGREGDSP